MRRFALLVGIVVALVLGSVSSAVAANPDVNHFSFTLSFTEGNFCGTGEAVDVTVSVTGTVFLAPNQPVGTRTVSEAKITYTNPETGATVVRHAAGPVSERTGRLGTVRPPRARRAQSWRFTRYSSRPGWHSSASAKRNG